MTSTTLGERILAARQAKEYSQADVSKRIGCSRASVAQWETGVTSPSIARVTEIAKILSVRPEALAYGVTTEPKIVYREPEDLGYLKIPEIKFGLSSDDRVEIGRWGAPIEWIKGEVRANPDALIVFSIVGDAMGPKIEHGDKIIVDTDNYKPSPPGMFLHWDGIGAAVNHMAVHPGGSTKKTMVRVTGGEGTESYEADAQKIKVIGRVVGVWKKS